MCRTEILIDKTYEIFSRCYPQFKFYGRVGMPGCVGTVPKFRNRGIAIEMVARATQYLKDSGMDISFIYFTGVADWYKKLGYETFMTEVFMVKEL